MHKKISIPAFFLGTAFLLGACSPLSSPSSMEDMDIDSDLSSQDFAPLVAGIYEDGEILFIHTEASDQGVATMLTEMMGGPVVVLVPELAAAPTELLAKVYVFTN